jgi:uncharacterized membrane protein YeaQ/YmgE (transglycosylase-associated protein family)
MIALIIGIAISGLVIGALGRLVVPGPNPMSMWHTMAFGIAGSFLGGLLGRLVFGWRYGYSYLLSFLIAVGVTAGLIALTSRRRRLG